MASRKNRTKRPRPAVQRSAPPAASDVDDLVARAARALEAENGTTEEVEPADGMEVEGEVDVARLRKAVAEAERAQELASRRKRQYDEQAAAVDKRAADLDAKLAARTAEIDGLKAALDERGRKLDQEEEELAERLKTLHEREKELRALEQAARTDFDDYRHEQLRRLREELDRRRDDAEELLVAREKESTDRLAVAEHALWERSAELEALKGELEQRELEVRRRDRTLTAREQYLEQEVVDRAKEIEGRFDAQLAGLQLEITSWRRRYDMVRELAEQRDAELAERDKAAVALGHLSPTEAAVELEELRQRNAELRRELGTRPEGAERRLVELESRCQDLALEREDLLRQNEELRRSAAAGRISVVERENSRLVNQALERLNGVLQQEIRKHTEQLAELEERKEHASPFPACFGMDNDPKYHAEPPLARDMPALPDFVRQVRAAIASRMKLYYSERDLRCFVAGLASSRLHLLEGISGIGKTRLPEAFAAVIGATCKVVPVAAEWRSPQDLLGYYNAFERRFYETEFTQALYQAQLPLHRHKPFIVVLDEMNLSHPEQYFSEVLSAVERDETATGTRRQRPELTLMTARVDPAPALLRDGRALPLPDNVWFVGTANHDETTVSFADKTYDRSHVLELPARPEPFEHADPQPIRPVSMAVLRNSFQDAARQHPTAAQDVLAFFENTLGEQLRESLRISWGSRLKRQAAAFVPVVLAAGGGIGEAADHLLATKVLRKLRGRFEVQPPELEDLRELVRSSWGEVDPVNGPTASVRVLDAEIRARGVLA